MNVVLEERVKLVEAGLGGIGVEYFDEQFEYDLFGDYLYADEPEKTLTEVITDCKSFLSMSEEMQGTVTESSAVWAE